MKTTTALIILVLIGGCVAQSSIVTIGETQIQVEIADSVEEQRVGLMNRTALGTNEGMLFIFPDEKTRSFWMKNTLIPLDMIFISEEEEIVDIIENAVPCEADPCSLYTSEGVAMYVLEVNGGFAATNKIKKGQLVQLP